MFAFLVVVGPELTLGESDGDCDLNTDGCCEGDTDCDGEFDGGKDGPGDLVGGSDVSLLKTGTSDQKPTLCRH